MRVLEELPGRGEMAMCDIRMRHDGRVRESASDDIHHVRQACPSVRQYHAENERHGRRPSSGGASMTARIPKLAVSLERGA